MFEPVYLLLLFRKTIIHSNHAEAKLNWLWISDHCMNKIREFGLYSWDKDAQKNGEDKPLKEFDHPMDAIRYFANAFEKGGLRVGKRGV